MKGILRLFAVLAATCAALPLAAGTTADAADGDSDAVGFAGTAATNPPVQLIGGTGVFNFASNTCEIVSSDGEFGACAIAADGNFTNIVCGTGSVAGAANVTELVDLGVDNFNFQITFLAGIGAVSGGATGWVVITPIQAGPPPNCSSDFEVVGALALN